MRFAASGVLEAADFDAADERKGDAAVGQHAHFLLQGIFAPDRDRGSIAGTQAVHFDRIGGERCAGREQRHNGQESSLHG